MNHKPNEKLKYVLEADPNLVEAEKKMYKTTDTVPTEYEEDEQI
jgi:hypothetical protein